METNVITFEIRVAFDEWVKTYDESMPLQKEAGIESLFRGFSKSDPSKCVAVMRAVPGKLDEFMAANAEMIAQSGHVLESTVVTTYLD